MYGTYKNPRYVPVRTGEERGYVTDTWIRATIKPNQAL